MLRHTEHPIVFSVEHSHPLAFANRQLLVAARAVVADSSHTQVCRTFLRRSEENLGFERSFAAAGEGRGLMVPGYVSASTASGDV